MPTVNNTNNQTSTQDPPDRGRGFALTIEHLPDLCLAKSLLGQMPGLTGPEPSGERYAKYGNERDYQRDLELFDSPHRDGSRVRSGLKGFERLAVGKAGLVGKMEA
jgi:hypothetical protein